MENGTKPNLAEFTIARRIAAIVLAMWKNQEVYRPEKVSGATTKARNLWSGNRKVPEIGGPEHRPGRKGTKGSIHRRHGLGKAHSRICPLAGPNETMADEARMEVWFAQEELDTCRV